MTRRKAAPVADASVPGDAPVVDGDVADPSTNAPLGNAAVAVTGDPRAAAAVLAKQAKPDPVEHAATRSEETAKQLKRELGDPSVQDATDPVVSGEAVAPAETSDGHTVDASGTADDHARVATPASDDSSDDSATSALDERAAKADRNKGVSAGQDTAGVELSFKSLVRGLAASGVHRDLPNQWVGEAYADLQGERAHAKSAGLPDPYPLLVF